MLTNLGEPAGDAQIVDVGVCKGIVPDRGYILAQKHGGHALATIESVIG